MSLITINTIGIYNHSLIWFREFNFVVVFHKD